MAQRLYQQFPKSLIKEVVSIYGHVTIGSSGAPSISISSKNMGIQSVVRNSTGNYTVILGNAVSGSVDEYNSLLSFHGVVQYTSGISAVTNLQVYADNVQSAGSFIIQCAANGVAADPESGSILKFEVKLKNSSSI